MCYSFDNFLETWLPFLLKWYQERSQNQDGINSDGIVKNNEKIVIGVTGLENSGKSRLIAALANVAPELLENEKRVEFGKNGEFLEIHHPNYGYTNPDEMEAKLHQYFEELKPRNLSCLLNVVNGDFREEDIFACQIALQMGMEVAIIRTKSDEWLDGRFSNDITSLNKRIFANEDKKYIRDIALSVNEAVANCPVFNVSAFAINSVSKKSKRAEIMQNYLIDEMALIEYLESFGLSLEYLKAALHQANIGVVKTTKLIQNPMMNIVSQVANKGKIAPNILFVGRIGAGKSSIIDALRGIKKTDENSATKNNCCIIQNARVVEFGYQQPSSNFLDGLNQYDLTQLKQIYLVVGDVVDEMDIKIAQYAIINGFSLTVLLSKTDIHIDNATEAEGFNSNFVKLCYDQKKAAASHEFARLINHPIKSYVISSIVIRSKDKFGKYSCDEEEFKTDFNKHIL